MDTKRNITSETLDNLVAVTRSVRGIHDLFMKHWQGLGYDCSMRRGDGIPTKERGYINDVTPDKAQDYIDNFINPYLNELHNIETAMKRVESFLKEGLIDKVKGSIDFARGYKELLQQHAKLDLDDESYDNSIGKIHAAFKDLGDPGISAHSHFHILNDDAEVELVKHAKPEVFDSDTTSEDTNRILQVLGIRLETHQYQRAVFRKVLGEYNTPSRYLTWCQENPPSEAYNNRKPARFIGGDPLRSSSYFQDKKTKEAIEERRQQVRSYLEESGWLWSKGVDIPTFEGIGRQLTRGPGEHVVESEDYYPMPQNHQLWKTGDGIVEIFDLDREAGTYLMVVVVPGLAEDGNVYGPMTEWPPWRADLVGGPGAPWQSAYGTPRHEIANVPDDASKLVSANDGLFYKAKDVKR